jgi:hypothetical protein
MTIRGWLLLVLVAALALAILTPRQPARREPVFDATGPVFSIEPPEWARQLHPYDPDPPVPK